MSLVQSSVYVKEIYGLSMTPEEILAEWMDMVYHAYAEEIPLKPGAKEYLEFLKNQGIHIGLVTACAPELCTACLKNNGIDRMFDAITYVDDVGKGKDFPDIYIECLRRLNAEPKNTVLFEDILTGLRTAKKIGLRVVAVEEDNEEDVAMLKQEADLYIKDFYEMLYTKEIG
jgi:HAD superfamily hydrolase (TIGR01509 family)